MIKAHPGTCWLEQWRTRLSLHHNDIAAIVAVGFMPLEVGQMLPSKINRLG